MATLANRLDNVHPFRTPNSYPRRGLSTHLMEVGVLFFPDALCSEVVAHKLDVTGIMETWLNDDIPDS